MQIASDLRFAFRSLAKTPLFTAVAVLSLALGIGANTAIFSLIDQLMLRLLPVRNPAALVLLDSHGNHLGNTRGPNSFSYPMYRDFAAQSRVFSGMLCRVTVPIGVSFSGRTERVAGEMVSGSYFGVLGVGAALGRTIAPEDDTIALGHPVTVLSYRYWQSRFAANPAILNQTVVLNGHNFTVIGVAARGFDGIEPGSVTDLYVPVTMKAWMTPNAGGMEQLEDRRSAWLQVIGRLKPGVTRAQAKASMQVLFHQILEQEAKDPQIAHASEYERRQFLRSTIDLLPGAAGRSFLRDQMSVPLKVLMGIVALVLLIACGNVANLLLVRAAGRRREIAVRLAMGANRWRIMRQLLAESVLLSFSGGLAGVAVAYAGTRALLDFLPQDSASLGLAASPDARVLLFNFAVALVTGLLFGLAPAVQSANADVASTLKSETRGVAGGHARLRQSLVVAQVTLSLLLLIGAGLFLRSLRNLRDAGPGFPSNHLIVFTLDPSLNGYNAPRSLAFFRELERHLAATPGVQSAAMAMQPIIESQDWESNLNVEGYTAKPGENMDDQMNVVTPGYFATLGVPLVEGRDFNDRDTGSIQHRGIPFRIPNVVVVNDVFARHYFGNRSPIGRHLGFGTEPGDAADMEIIGVVQAFKHRGIRDARVRQVFMPSAGLPVVRDMTTYVRTSVPPSQAFHIIRHAVASLDRDLPVYNLRTLDNVIDASLLNERLVASLSALFGVLATLLAVIGLYGVMAYTVEQRTREIGIRMAVGAQGRNVLWLVMRDAVTMIAAGFLIGLPAAWLASKLVASLLYGIEPHDPAVIAAAMSVLACVALLAGYVPALRASRIDPLRALHYE